MVTLNKYLLFMKNLLNKLNGSQKGFTLIELLVVIGILGILAAALVATIDPFEQLKKADDAKIKNIVAEFENANIRYYTTHGAFPWADSNSTNTDCTGLAAGSPWTKTLTQLDNCIKGGAGIVSTLISEGELKSSFDSNATDMGKVYVTWDTNSKTSLTVCFAPTSKSQKASAETIYTQAGVENKKPTGSCPDGSSVDGTCYWCTK